MVESNFKLNEMLSIDDTMTSIFTRLKRSAKAFRDFDIVRRSSDPIANTGTLILTASCFELDRASLGSSVVKQIKQFNLHNKPDKVGFTLSGVGLNTFCDPTEVLIVCQWTKQQVLHRSLNNP